MKLSITERMHALHDRLEGNGCTKDLLERVFVGSSMDAFDNGSEVTDVIVWDEGSQSAIAFLARQDDSWRTTGFSICEDTEVGSWDEWKDFPEAMELVEACIAYARENDISLEEVGCIGATPPGDGLEDVDDAPEYGGTTLYNEVKAILKLNAYGLDDVLYAEVMAKDCNVACIEGARFLEMAKKVKFNLHWWSSKPVIQDDLKIVLKDGSYLVHMHCDGSEWFKLCQAPDMNPKYSSVDFNDLCFLTNDASKENASE